MNYKTAYEKNAAFYNARPIAKKILIASNYALTIIFAAAYLAFAIASFFLFERKDIIKIFAIPAFCLLLVSSLRFCINRPRPYSEKGANIQPISRGKRKDGQSFPSRHVACAFAIAVVFFPYLAWAGILLTAFGLGLCYTRFALGVHYPTDLLAGTALGLLCGLFLLI